MPGPPALVPILVTGGLELAGDPAQGQWSGIKPRVPGQRGQGTPQAPHHAKPASASLVTAKSAAGMVGNGLWTL